MSELSNMRLTVIVSVSENEFMQRVCEWDKDRRCKAWLNPPPPCTADTVTLPYEYSTARITQFVEGASHSWTIYAMFLKNL